MPLVFRIHRLLASFLRLLAELLVNSLDVRGKLELAHGFCERRGSLTEGGFSSVAALRFVVNSLQLLLAEKFALDLLARVGNSVSVERVLGLSERKALLKVLRLLVQLFGVVHVISDFLQVVVAVAVGVVLLGGVGARLILGLVLELIWVEGAQVRMGRSEARVDAHSVWILLLELLSPLLNQFLHQVFARLVN